MADDTNVGVLCQSAIYNTEMYQSECFLQTLGVHTFGYIHMNFINTFFMNNIAHQSGSDIYGGLLDRCTINPLAEVAAYINIKAGFDYIKATTQIEQIIDYSAFNHQPDSTKLDHFVKTISNSDVKGLISSDAVQIQFGSDNVISPDYSHPNVLIKKGETFSISLVAVDQVGNPLNATIVSSLSSESGNGHLKDSQVARQIGDQCTELQYNVYSVDDSAQLYIHADGPCGDIGISSKRLDLIFLPCICGVGYHPSPSENDCICECDQSILAFCLNNVVSPNYTHPNISIKKGETFTVSLGAAHTVGNPLTANIISSYSSESGKGHVKDSQVIQQVGNQCTELEYNVYSVETQHNYT